VDVPWGFICGYPTDRGDLYGGAHYSQSCGNFTPQGKAIQEASERFGDGKTLPFTPCKKGYVPINTFDGTRMAACPLHNKHRWARLRKEKMCFRKGEVDLNFFWEREEKEASLASLSEKEEKNICTKKQPQNCT